VCVNLRVASRARIRTFRRSGSALRARVRRHARWGRGVERPAAMPLEELGPRTVVRNGVGPRPEDEQFLRQGTRTGAKVTLRAAHEAGARVYCHAFTYEELRAAGGRVNITTVPSAEVTVSVRKARPVRTAAPQYSRSWFKAANRMLSRATARPDADSAALPCPRITLSTDRGVHERAQLRTLPANLIAPTSARSCSFASRSPKRRCCSARFR
jgi:hypothetical protein